MPALPIVLSIAGSDPGGGAGIQADLKTFQAFGAFGAAAITAVTVQNTLGVWGVHAVPVEVVRAQVDAVASDLPPAATKTGMLASAALVESVAAAVREWRLPNYVLDPVMAATSGDRLLAREAEARVRDALLPLSALVTPNLDEAEILTGFRVRTPVEMRRAAAALVEMGAGAALVKGGHLEGDEITNLLHDGREWWEWTTGKVETRNTHGTGCTLSAAIAAGLAHGRPLARAVEQGLDFVRRAILAAPGYGQGHGPLNHLVGAAR